MKKRQLKELERLLDNCDFYCGEDNFIRLINEVGALRGFTYALKPDWQNDVDSHLLDRFNRYIDRVYNEMNKNDEVMKRIKDIFEL